ncbi:MAG: imidazole glycerol phosphate synthase subunit HisH [Anaerolineae bacterium]|nr:imidazole glycerol phosphate synthase subunit HisH [Anaerolineae bacterium]
MIAIIDYGIGNLRSVEKAFRHVGADVLVTGDPQAVRAARALVLPGVGAFADGMAQLKARGLVPVIEEAAAARRPILGICLGMQLLFEGSDEMGRHRGLGLLRGRARRFPPGLKVPHIGWNQVHIVRPSPLLEGLSQDSYAYFAHSYYVDPAGEDTILATTEYGRPFASVVGAGSCFGLQFHPEKSQDVGLGILERFVALVRGRRSSL